MTDEDGEPFGILSLESVGEMILLASPMTYVSILAGMIVLVVGGELLVRNASRLAVTAGVSPLVVGLTVVAYGTGTPELMSSVYGQWVGESALAVGNVVGSNIFNVFFILGLSALVAPLTVDTKLLRHEVPIVVAVSLLTCGFAYAGAIERWEAGVLLARVPHQRPHSDGPSCGSSCRSHW